MQYLKMSSITFFSTHHDPHGAPLCHVNWLDYARDFVHKRDGARDVVQNLSKNIPYDDINKVDI